VFSTQGAGSVTRKVHQGFIGKFGSNGHNATKTRGVLLGNSLSEPEGCTITLGITTVSSTIFVKAGDTGIRPLTYQTGGAADAYGEGFPTGSNPVITTKDSGGTSIDLNLGARSWLAGISRQYGAIIRPRSIVI
jgi:hypothetical protein